ncbi:MAG: GH92 family glycosyl hydrolase, partial [Bacteroidota bacterium]|nr:GH92 family glycosyl hydrolase [Bacteroidota bacterium]
MRFPVYLQCALLAIIILSCSSKGKEDYTQYVNPFVGTSGHGHTFPGATTPFGMVQLSPDTGTDGWDWCSGYHYSDSTIIGFSHTHLSGTGTAEYGDILFMPFTGKIILDPGPKDKSKEGYRSRFSHRQEKASPGYYSVLLQDHNIFAELTATPRTGFHRYTFNNSNEVPEIILDLEHGIQDKSKETWVKLNGTREVVGLRRSQGWASNQYVYFVAQFSAPFKEALLYENDSLQKDKKGINGKSTKAVFTFDKPENKQILLKVGISAVSIEGARKNLESENSSWNFDRVRNRASTEWNDKLSVIEVKGGTPARKTVFYTALYHAMIQPNVFSDMDGRYRGLDGKIQHVSRTHDNAYTVFSLWDTFRAAHPLYSLIFPDKNQEFIRTMLLQYSQSGSLPVWELAGNETGSMIGYHAVSVIWDAVQKNQKDFHLDFAYNAMKAMAMKNDRGLSDYRNLGFIPMEREANSVSKTLEYAYDDWCVAQMALKMGKKNDYKEFIKRAQYYKNCFDSTLTFARGRHANGSWQEDFNPVASSTLGTGVFTEGNSWQYTFFVPHDINTLIRLFGGAENFNRKLDELFSQPSVRTNDNALDISGLIGQYAQGNEPSHHIAYLYDYVGYAFKTQAMVRRIMNELYSDKPDGLCGNEDCGQMSAWYVFSAMGFYPVCPGTGQYAIGSPAFDEVTIHLDHGKDFIIRAHNNKPENCYTYSSTLNGVEYNKSFLMDKDIRSGGILEFYMSSIPNQQYGNKLWARPYSLPFNKDLELKSVEHSTVFIPWLKDDRTLFSVNKTIDMRCNTLGAEIHYTLDGSEPRNDSPIYTHPFIVTKSCCLRAKAFKEGLKDSEELSVELLKSYVNTTGIGFPKVSYSPVPAQQYNGLGKGILMDGYLGTSNFRDGRWMGFEGSVILTVDLGGIRTIKSVGVSMLRSPIAWIMLPEKVVVSASVDNRDFVP